MFFSVICYGDDFFHMHSSKCSYPQPGVKTDEIDEAVHQMIIDNGAYPSPLGYGGFPKSVCTSINECICHGIPDSRSLEVCSVCSALLY